ncbi:allantoate permease [Xylariales sp. PMI_506]|nr:allantoate permease [Xylariales sp. PMI_506]
MSEKEEVQMAERADSGDNGETLTNAKTVDTVHNDEALRVIANYDGDPNWEPAEEAKLRRKVDWKLMPILCITYGLQYYDKAMLSQAALFGLRTDLELTVGNRYSWTASIFYLGFIIGAYPTMYLAQRFPIERVASSTVTLWGLTLILTTVCKNYQSIYAQRFFLGFLESGVSPMFMLIVGSWYKKDEQAMRMGIWYSCTGYVSIFSPLINYGLGKINGGTDTWRYMYYFAGGLTTLWGLILYFVLPPDPIRAKGFNPRERFILVSRLRSNNSGVRNTHFKKEQLIELLTDYRYWILFCIALLSMIANAPISTFAPIVINGFGFSTFNSLLLVIPAGFYGGSVQLLFPWLSRKFPNSRAYIVFGAQMGTTLAALLLWNLPLDAKAGLMFAISIMPSIGGGYAVLMSLSIANTAGYTKRSIAASGLYIGYCLGNFIGPFAFQTKDAPRYVPGFIVVVITSIAAGLLALLYRFVCVSTNKSRDKSGVLEGFDHAYEDDSTDMKNPQFRYEL